MTVWDLDDARASELGAASARSTSSATPTCARACRRTGPTTSSPWCTAATAPRSRRKRAEIAALLGPPAARHDILYSTRILKKTGLRLAGGGRLMFRLSEYMHDLVAPEPAPPRRRRRRARSSRW